MAVVYRDLQDRLGYRHDDAEETRHPIPALPAARVLRFDERTNAAALAALDANHGAHSLVPGSPAVLMRSGVAVTIAAPGPGYRDRNLRSEVRDGLRDLPPLPMTDGATTAAVAMLQAIRDAIPLTPVQERQRDLLVFQLLRDLRRIVQRESADL